MKRPSDDLHYSNRSNRPREYEAVVGEAMPAIGAEQVQHLDPGPGWRRSKAGEVFF